jgi:two-component system cell cycle sensor histidine kinase/response regulator CckA
MPNARILIVEDDLIVAQSIEIQLKSLGYEVPVIVTTGQEAVHQTGEIQPDLVLMDIKLPGETDGVEAAAQIRTRYGIPVIYLTAYADEKTLARAKITEPFGYILKPFGGKELHSTIEMALYKHRTERQVEHLNRVLWAIRNVNQLITREKDRDRLLNGACECLIETRGYHSVWIAGIDESGRVVTVAQAGLKESLPSLIEQLERGEWPGCWREAMAQPGVLSIEDPFSTCAGCLLEERYRGWGKMAVRLEHDKQVYGMMAVSLPAELVTDEEERTLFKEVATDIAFALHSIQEEEKRKQAEKALRESEAQYRSFLQNFQGIVYRGQMDFTPLFFHGAVGEITGYTEEEFITGEPRWDQVIHPEDLPKIFTEDEARLHSVPHHSYEREYRIVRKDGQVRWVYEFIQNVCDDSGKPVMAQGVLYDITERKQAEEALQQSENRYKRLLESVTDYIYTVKVEDGQPAATSHGPGCEAVTGYTPEEYEVDPYLWYRMIYPEDRAMVTEQATRLIAGETVPPLEHRLIHKDGSLRWVRNTPVPRYDQNTHLVAYDGLIADITERKQADEALRQERDRAQQYLDIAEVMLVALNEQGKITLLNRKGHRILGYEEGELLGKNWFDTCLPAPVREEVKKVFNRLMAGEIEPVEYHENPVLTSSGEERMIAWHNIILTDEAGNITGTLSSGEDITARKQAEKEKEKLQAQLLQMQKMEAIGRLTGGIAHDFNNLLTAINGFAELAQHKLPPDDPLQEMLGYILASGQRAADLIRQLLAFSSKQIIEPKIMSLNSLITDLDAMLRRIIGEDIQIETSLAPDLWPIKVDPAQIEQIVVNLAVNARDAMPDGGKLTIEAANIVLTDNDPAGQPEIQSGEYILLSISDTGKGMSEAVLEHIFEPFFTTKAQNKGTGLGLATVYGIVKQHEGDIRVHSEEGQGTTFKIYLPRAGATLQAAPRPKTKVKMPVGSETILLVEDDAQVRDLARQVLEGQGYKVLEVENGQEALQLADHYADPIHLLLTDVVMPGMDGRALAEQLLQTRPNLKTIFISGYADETIAHHGILEPGIALLQKPFSPVDLARKVREILDAPAPRE